MEIQYGLIGRSLKHSFSKSYFENKFEQEKLTHCSYSLFELEQIEDLEMLLQNNPNLLGFNVTIPYKEQVIHFLDELSPEALAIGAVNCVKINKGIRIGHNTDAFGFHQSIKPFLRPIHSKALILGTGGASKAVAFVLDKIGIEYSFVSRAKAANTFTYSELNTYAVSLFPLIINTTPLGTFPNFDACPELPLDGISNEHLIIDLIYNPAETKLLRLAKERGATTLNGLTMLKEQANKSWDIWQDAMC